MLRNIPGNFLKRLSFWGVAFLLIITIGFRVDFRDIFMFCYSGKRYLDFLCIYMVISIPVCAAMTAWNLTKLTENSYTFFEALFIDLNTNLWTPYQGFAYKAYFYGNEKKSDMAILYAEAIIEMIIWWFIVIFGVINIISVADNPIMAAINNLSRTDLLIRIAIVVGVYLVLVVICGLLERYFYNKWSKR